MREPGPLVSVVVPCYNTERFIRAAVESALAQEYANVEIVVVDDGSTDSSPSILREYGDRIVLVAQTNSGLSAARNAGIAAARGEFIVLMDADDMLLPSCVGCKVEQLMADDAIGLVTGNVRFVDEEGRQIPGTIDIKPALPDGLDYRNSLRYCIGPPTGWAFRKSAWQRVGGFDPLLRSTEDVDFRLRMGVRYKVTIDHEPQALYREVAGSMSRDFVLLYDELRKVLRKNRAYGVLPRWSYDLCGAKGVLNACAGMFQRIFKERRKEAPSLLLGLFRRRPSMALFFAAWGLRAVWNRVQYRLGRGPLVVKERALREVLPR